MQGGEPSMQGKTILVTGASGFIGSFIVEEALNRGMDVWAAVRKSSSRQWLGDPRIHFIELDLGNTDRLREQLSAHKFDYVVHAAGVTKTLHQEDFFRVNTEGTRHLAQAVAQTQPQLLRLVFLSSLSIFGAVREEVPHTDILPSDTPRPNTGYGRSKLQAEQALEAVEGLPWVMLRPTGVYGPREKDYFLMARSISRHTDFAVGFRRQDITFVYVKDVVQAVFLALWRDCIGKKYFLSDGEVYQSTAFSDLIISELGHPWCLRIKAPLWVLRVATAVGELTGRMTGSISALNNDKYHILKQRNWRCDISDARRELGFVPRYQLERGVKETIAWYRQQGWL